MHRQRRVGRAPARVGSARVGSARVGSGRVGSSGVVARNCAGGALPTREDARDPVSSNTEGL
ncbi:hypothetical protein ES689_09260 [Frigoribacterium sp. ACAM 257]|uniref:hypothetical protein n=1 Tax=Frigoribacterium sp. ACAM 257 TaxID=2508998 RepID=UPI0011BA15A2|nr:hypothetical protein [Frigoribacterium sp. ACAM 257]TWX38785.1 hypothetical protein ES689_09260 [Frigoribacterium sp. ACAM 257]